MNEQKKCLRAQLALPPITFSGVDEASSQRLLLPLYGPSFLAVRSFSDSLHFRPSGRVFDYSDCLHFRPSGRMFLYHGSLHVFCRFFPEKADTILKWDLNPGHFCCSFIKGKPLSHSASAD